MPDRASTGNLFLSLVAFVVFMVVVLAAVGSFGVGTVELAIWLALVAAGIVLIVRRYRRARATSGARS